ncbi:hypothetical protein EW145_g3072 [Phellinidium pouzarii]|uniref:Carboxypeptidase n=1 Tax=Phellinidium pouzarii TaxID=167371 RepID=A0A4S4L8P1_9AGAM|nr:hypothetical protein EW145_g3072 [Phellinidium pouzarii]
MALVEHFTLYTARICPYAQRAEIALAEAGAKFTRYEIDLQNKPVWYAPEVNPASKVPAIAYGGPEVPPDQPSPKSVKIPESLVLLDFFADLYPESGLLPKDPVLRAKARLFIDAVSTKLVPGWGGFVQRGENVDALYAGLEAIQGLLPSDATFAVGNTYTIADAAAAPFLARIEVLLKNDIGAYAKGEGKAAYEVYQSKRFSKLRNYFDSVKARDSFKTTFDELSGALLTSLLVASTAIAVPFDELELQAVLSDLDLDFAGYSAVFGNVAQEFKTVVKGAKKLAGDVEQTIERFFKDGSVRDFVKQHGITYELLQSPLFKDYQMRVTEPTLCDPGVKQLSGYLDITDGKHLFFWFFESRTAPEDAPLILWLNGGPGCSSSTGLLFELGPCSIANEGRNVTYNPHSWNSNANIIFLDQPVNVGFSYSDDGSSVNTSPVAGVDVYAFLQLFLARYPKYAKAPFHLAAESYGGTYVPNFANVIHKKNKELEFSGNSDVTKINLESVMIGNGITDPYIQDASIPTFACDGPYPIYDDPDGPECTSLRGKVPTCQRLIDSCYKYSSRLTCVPAALYCNSQLYGPIQQSGKNPYDVRRTCDPAKDTTLCYREMGWIETWMSNNQKALGASPSVTFESCNMQINQAFLLQGDGMHNSALLLTELVNDGIRLLIYAGNADYMCNFIGNEAWLTAFDSQFHDEFSVAETLPWVTSASSKLAGSVRSAGSTSTSAGNVTFVTVFEAGHMVPYDQPEAALDLLTKWISGIPLSDVKQN